MPGHSTKLLRAQGLSAEEGVVPSKQGPPTLADVAASAGVSIATVSKVLNGRADVGPGTRARVQSILQQHDYIGRRSEPVEHALKGGATVELVFHGQLTSYSVEVLKGVVEAATQSGVTVAVSLRPREMGPGVKRSDDWVRDVATSGRSAVIDVVDDLRQGDLAALSRARLPLVVIDPLTLPHRQVTSPGCTAIELASRRRASPSPPDMCATSDPVSRTGLPEAAYCLAFPSHQPPSLP